MKSPSRPTFPYSAYRTTALAVCLLIGLTGQVAFGQAPATPPASKVLQMPGSNPNLPKYKPNEVLVRFRKGVGQAAIAAVHGKVGGQVIRTYRSVEGLQHVRIPSNMKVEEAIRRYRQNPEVLYAEPNYRRQATVIPNDPMFSDLWGLDNFGQSGGVPDADIDAPEAWNLSTGSSSVIVADIDTGIDYNHEDLVANVFNNPNDCDGDSVDDDGNGWVDDCHGIDTVNWDSDPWDDGGHGTHTAGTIGAAGNNGLGVVGVNWNVTIMACKFLGASGGSDDGAIACLDYIAWMKDNGYNIVATNNSWGGPGFNQALLDAILAQGQRGILFFAAAGNWSLDNDVLPFYPANYYAPNLISVAATNRYDGVASFSHWGRRTVHVGAPGEEILSTVPAVNDIPPCTPGDFYCSIDGTSMATPHVTGLAALLKAQDGSRDWRAIKNLILAGGDANSSLANTVTQKRLNAYGAMTCSNSTVFSRLRPIPNSTGTGVGVPLDLSALNINCAAPNGDVPVTVEPGGTTVTLLDDGAGTDLAAGDGIYSGQWTPGAPGTYTLTFPDGDVVTVNVLPSYFYLPAPYNYRTIAGTNLQFGDDSSAMITPPFTVQFGGGSFSDVFVGSNGNINFTNYFTQYWNDPLPTGAIETLIAPFWDDLYAFSGTGQNVFWEVIGTEPNRELVIEWRDISHYPPDAAATVKFQVVFYEGRSDILFNYADVYFGGGFFWADQGAAATVGVQVGSGVATQYSFDTPSLSDSFALFWTLSVVTLDPSSVDFGDVPVGTPSAPQTITLTNNPVAPVSLGVIEITPADFTQTNDCVSPIAPGGTCTFTVTFTPTGTGTVNGTLIIVHDASDGLNVISLTGNGVGPFAQLSASDLSFASQVVNSTSATQAVTLANTGNQAMTITGITASTGFTVAAPDCLAGLAAGANCTLNVAFAPTATGAQAGEVTISSNAYPGTHRIGLSGTGTAVDIVVPPGNPTSITVNAGQAADFNLSLGPLSGFTGTVALSCTETIPEGSCSVTPASATLDGVTPVNVTVRATTTARSAATPNPVPLRPLPPLVNLVGLLWLLSLVAFATLAAARRDARRHARLALGTALLLIALWAACGGGGAPAPAPPRGTPAGTYTITVTATVGNFTDSTTLNLTVN